VPWEPYVEDSCNGMEMKQMGSLEGSQKALWFSIVQKMNSETGEEEVESAMPVATVESDAHSQPLDAEGEEACGPAKGTVAESTVRGHCSRGERTRLVQKGWSRGLGTLARSTHADTGVEGEAGELEGEGDRQREVGQAVREGEDEEGEQREGEGGKKEGGGGRAGKRRTEGEDEEEEEEKWGE